MTFSHVAEAARRDDPKPCEIVLTAWPYECVAKDRNPDDLVYTCTSHRCWWHVAATRDWQSPNGVVHHIVKGSCVTCGQPHYEDSPTHLEPSCDACDAPLTDEGSSSAYDVNGDLSVTVCVECSRLDWHAIAAAQEAQAQAEEYRTS